MPKFEQKLEINAPVDAVWTILTDMNHWSQWFPDIESVSSIAVQPSAAFSWQSHGHNGSGGFTKVEPGKTLGVMLQVAGHKTIHTFHLSRHFGLFSGNGATLEYEMEYTAPGGALGNFLFAGNPADMLRVKNTLSHLKTLAERAAASGHKK